MKKIMIADPSKVFVDAMRQLFSKDYDVLTCTDGLDAENLIPVFQPDLLILNLFLPMVDGLSVLRHISGPRPIILVISPPLPDYIIHTAMDLGASYFITVPCRLEDIREHVDQMLLYSAKSTELYDPESFIDTHLQRLGLNPAMDGTKQLRVGIPLFAKDMNQRLIKELYPAIAAACGNGSIEQVEHSIRDAIKNAWNNRDAAVWRAYFPYGNGENEKCPTNKLFISRLALELTKAMHKNTTHVIAR